MPTAGGGSAAEERRSLGCWKRSSVHTETFPILMMQKSRCSWQASERNFHERLLWGGRARSMAGLPLHLALLFDVLSSSKAALGHRCQQLVDSLTRECCE